jgi:outer membrane receptor protein involved in Fe transport
LGGRRASELPGRSWRVEWLIVAGALFRCGSAPGQGTNDARQAAATNAAALTNSVAAPAMGTNQAPVRLPVTVVEGRQDSMLGLADSAGQGTTGAAQLADRPILRSGEILETVPGVIITQHAGGGKANQYFLRGFNLDHGTDFAVFLDDMPLNLPTHAHGQGYSDMNTVIPEFVQRVDYEKGPYDPAVGDFGSVGAAHLEFYKALPQDFVTIEGGMYGFERGVAGASTKLGSGTLLFGGEVSHDDGPWVHPDDYSKFNGILTYSLGDEANGFSVTARAYHGTWNSSDQLAESAIPVVGYFGTLNPTDGGTSERYSLQAEWHRQDANSATKVTLYGFYYGLDLFSDFSYYLVDPLHGDQFEQQDKRWVAGLDARHSIFSEPLGREMENTFGARLENFWINNGIYETEDRVRIDKINADPDVFGNPYANLPVGAVIPETLKQDAINQSQVGLFFENKTQWLEKFRTVTGVRGDIYAFAVDDVDPANSGHVVDGLASPKASLIFGPWAKTEYYLQGGFGFHSDDARATTTTTNVDGTFVGGRAPGLIQTKGAEVGARTLAVPHLQSTLALWYLHSDSELLMDGDTGETVATPQPSNRYGVELSNYYAPIKYLALDFDVADSAAYFSGVDTQDVGPGSKGGYHVPEAVGLVMAGGITLHDLGRFSASLRLRYFGPRDLTADGAYRSNATLLLNAQASYRLNKTWTLFAEVLNLLDSRDHDIDYAYESRISPTATPLFQDHFHPVEPVQARAGITARF